MARELIFFLKFHQDPHPLRIRVNNYEELKQVIEDECRKHASVYEWIIRE